MVKQRQYFHAHEMHEGVDDHDWFFVITKDCCCQLTFANWGQIHHSNFDIRPKTYHHCESVLISHLYAECRYAECCGAQYLP